MPRVGEDRSAWRRDRAGLSRRSRRAARSGGASYSSAVQDRFPSGAPRQRRRSGAIFCQAAPGRAAGMPSARGHLLSRVFRALPAGWWGIPRPFVAVGFRKFLRAPCEGRPAICGASEVVYFIRSRTDRLPRVLSLGLHRRPGVLLFSSGGILLSSPAQLVLTSRSHPLS